jgi:hypothetical protein
MEFAMLAKGEHVLNDDQLARTLKSVGKTCFIRFFHEFSSTTMSREDIIHKLRVETNYTEGSCVSRVSHARRIFSAGLAAKALNIIISSNSKVISEEIRVKAQQLIKLLASQ